MIKLVIVAILSFVFGFFIQDILERIRKKKKPKKLKQYKVKPYNQVTSEEKRRVTEIE